jgi:hypothetical protein
VTFGVFGKLSTRRGAFHDVWTWGAKVLEYWMISSLKIKLNRSWNFWRNSNVPLVLLERSWWAGLHGISLVNLDSKCGRHWFLSDFCRWKFKYIPKNGGFGRKNQLKTWWYLGQRHRPH